MKTDNNNKQQHARQKAFELTAAMANHQHNTSTVSYLNKGHLLIVLDSQGVERIQPSWVKLLAQLPQVSFLTTTAECYQKFKQITYLNSFTLYQSAGPYPIEGYLGAFFLTPATNPIPFDMVLDLTQTGVMPQAVAAIGYYPLVKQLIAKQSENPYGVMVLEIQQSAQIQVTIEQWLQAAPTLIGQFEKPQYIKWQRQSCAHQSCGLTGCTACLTSCPAGALSTQRIASEQMIVVDTKLCQGLGSCAIACPTDALQYNHPHQDHYHDYLSQLLNHYREAEGTHPVVLFYSDASDNQQKQGWLQQLPAFVLPVPLEELGSLGLNSWLHTLACGAYQVLLLIDEQLHPCVLTLLQSQQQLFSTLIQDLIDTDASKAIQFVDLNSDPTQLTFPDRPLFTTLVTTADNERASSTDEPTKPTYQNEKRATLTTLLDRILQQRGQPNRITLLSNKHPFGQVICDPQRCTLCMGCVHICPTKSLTALSENEPGLRFQEQNCIQCGLCVQTCPEQALTLETRYLWDQQQRHTPKIIAQQKAAHCIVCDIPFAPENLIEMMVTKLQGHAQFQGDAAKRLRMCETCRVKDQFELFAQSPEDQLTL